MTTYSLVCKATAFPEFSEFQHQISEGLDDFDKKLCNSAMEHKLQDLFNIVTDVFRKNQNNSICKMAKTIEDNLSKYDVDKLRSEYLDHSNKSKSAVINVLTNLVNKVWSIGNEVEICLRNQSDLQEINCSISEKTDCTLREIASNGNAREQRSPSNKLGISTKTSIYTSLRRLPSPKACPTNRLLISSPTKPSKKADAEKALELSSLLKSQVVFSPQSMNRSSMAKFINDSNIYLGSIQSPMQGPTTFPKTNRFTTKKKERNEKVGPGAYNLPDLSATRSYESKVFTFPKEKKLCFVDEVSKCHIETSPRNYKK